MKTINKLYTSAILLIIIFFTIRTSDAQVGIPKIYKNAIVVSATKEASEAGIQIIKQGGNAVDAAVAVCFTLSVTYPEAGNIGGGGFMVVHLSNGEVNTLDFRETAPASASRTMYQDKNGKVIKNLSREDVLAVGVPGTVDGMVNAVKKYGRLSLKQDMAPAIRLAQQGYHLSYGNKNALNRYRNKFLRYKGSSMYFTKPNSTLYQVGELFKQKDLAHTLELIAEKGREGFYSGHVADLIVKEMKARNGLITYDDLNNYHSVWRKPIVAHYKDYDLYMMPPPSSGGVAIKQILSMISPYDLKQFGFNSAKTIHLLTEAERRVYADRAYFLGDPSFVSMPIKYLTSKSYLTKRMHNFSWDHATRSSQINHGIVPKPHHESMETTHFSVVDPEGNAVSITYTLNGGFGSHVSVIGAGFLLNNEMDDFSAKPGVPNMYGLLGGEANAIQPNKRMLSSMTPTIITKNGKLNMVLGSPGGSTIITTVLQVFLDIADYGMNVQQAVAAPRVHNQWYPDKIFYDPFSFTNDTKKILEKMRHHLFMRKHYVGEADCIVIKNDGSRSGGADPRGENYIAGF